MIQPPIRRGFGDPNAPVPAPIPVVEPATFAENPPQAAPAETRYPVEFTGNAREYFRIWIVNMALTVVTLGIYSAWAKVRKRRYFYANTRLDSEGFEYRANPLAILKGRVIAVGLLAIFWVSFKFVPLGPYHVALAIIALAVLPWLIVKAHAFNAYNSAYRNIRLGFNGTYWRCLRVLLWNGFLMIVTFGIGYVFLRVRMIEFIARHHQYGTTRFEVPDLKVPVFQVYAKVIGVGMLVGLVIGAYAVGLGFIIAATGAHPPRNSPWINLPILAFTYTAYLFLFCYARSRVTNKVWELIRVGQLRFESRLGAWRLFWIYLTNILAIVASLGLLTPWAVVRSLRYRAACMTLVTAGSLGEFAQAEAAQVGASGEEMAEAFDVDFGL